MERTFLVRIAGSLGTALSVSDEPWKGDLSVTGPDAVTPERITAAARRKLGLPLVIAETETLRLRELALSDLPALCRFESAPGEDTFRLPEELRFTEKEYLSSYIDTQYRFFEFGIWGVFLKKRQNEKLIGLAGLSAGDDDGCPMLGYHISSAYRRRGYAYWAVTKALEWYAGECGGEEVRIVIDGRNTPSIRLSEKVKAFQPVTEERLLISITIL